MLQTIYTIGYQGLSIDDFILILHSHQVKHIIDIRRNPISRKVGFSKNLLAKYLEQTDIQYTHVVELGTPTDIRKELKTTENYELFFDRVEEYVKTQQAAIQVVVDLAFEQTSALMCFERAPEECHRLVVASHVVQRSDLKLNVEHIRF